MYNRYIGNTGKFYRVEEKSDKREGTVEHQVHAPVQIEEPIHISPSKKPFLFGGGGLKFLDNILPFGLETSDLIILILLLFLYIESGDEEFLIILGFLAYSIFKDYKDQ